LVNHKQELPVVAMFVNGSGQNVQSLERTFYRCFLPCFSSFGWGVSEKIKIWKVNRRRMPSDGKSSHCLWQGELKTYRGSLMPFNQGMCSVAWGGTPNMHILFFIICQSKSNHDITSSRLQVIYYSRYNWNIVESSMKHHNTNT
jgi:hypothetical protein